MSGSGAANDAQDDDLSEVRLLFDEYEPKVTRLMQVSPEVQVHVVCAEQTEPGALQSGMFVWPAAMALSKYLAQTLLEKYSHARTVIELGAGAGLVGLTAARIIQQAPDRTTSPPFVVVFTDRDRTSLKIIQQSIKACGGFGDNVQTVRKLLSWKEDPNTAYPELAEFTFDLAVGSDLIYSTESAQALMGTISAIMPRKGETEWQFLLSSSFRDPVTTDIIDARCAELGLKREVIFADYEKCLLETYKRA